MSHFPLRLIPHTTNFNFMRVRWVSIGIAALLAGVALYAFGTGPLKGFAITMIIGILTSVFTAVTVSRGIATLIYGRRRKLKSLAI